MAAKRKQPQSVDLDAILPSLSNHLKTHGAMKWTDMTRLGVPKPQHAAAIEQLRSAGFEDTPKCMRLPIAQQLLSALAERGQLPVKGLQNLVKGSSAKELVQAVEGLVKGGTVIRLLRTKAEWLAASNADVLSSDELHTLNRSVTDWAKQTSRVKGSRARALAIWREDFRGLLEALNTLAQSHCKPQPGVKDAQRLRQIISDNLNPSVKLAFVPTVVAQLQSSVEQAHALLIEEARRGRLELRPDAGTARFTEAELTAAPKGPDGSRLLWVRLLEVSL